MMRNVLFVLLLATGVVLANAQVKTDAPQGQTKEVQAKTASAQEQTEEAQEKTEAAQEQTEAAQEQTKKEQAKTENDDRVISGMSILGNQEAPKSLVIVPWKSSEIGNSMDTSTMLDDSRQPVDKEVFMRALRYYEIRSGTKP
jgi:cytoskeletal protein RodZ